MTDLDEDLAPWRALHRTAPASGRFPALHRQVLDRVANADPLAAPPGRRVLLAGDWHGDAAWASSVVRRAGRADVPLVLQLGDFGFWHGDAGEGYLDLVELVCRQEGVTVAFLDGNHEDHDRLGRYPLSPNGLRAVRPHVWHVPRGHRWGWAGCTWAAVGGAVSVDRSLRVPGVSWWPQEALTSEQAAAVAGAALLTCSCATTAPRRPRSPAGRPGVVAPGRSAGVAARGPRGLGRARRAAADRRGRRAAVPVVPRAPARALRRRRGPDALGRPVPGHGLADQTGGDGNTTVVRLDEPDRRET